MGEGVGRKLSDRVVFIWGVFWTLLVVVVLGWLWVVAWPIASPIPTVLYLVGILLASFLVYPLSRTDLTLTIGVGPAMYFLVYESAGTAIALALWSTAWFVGTLLRVRHIGDGAEAAAYDIGAVLVAALALHALGVAGEPVGVAATVCLGAYTVARLVFSTIRVPVVATIGVLGAFRAILFRRLVLSFAGLLGFVFVGHTLLGFVARSTPSINMVGVGAVAVILLGAGAFAFAMYYESQTLSTRLRGSVEAALTLPWSSDISVADHAVAFARKILPRYTIELRDSAGRNINEIVAEFDGSYLIARRGTNQPPFFIEDQEVLESVAHLAAMMAEVRREHDRLARAAATDELTGLPNYRGFHDAVERLDPAAGLAVVYLDINNFKAINDTYGHDVGNIVLRTFAGRLLDHLLPSALAARVGGDEFVILAPGAWTTSECEERVSQLLSQVTEPIKIGGQVLSISLSQGISIAPPGEIDFAALIADADQRMYAGRGVLGPQEQVAAPGEHEGRVTSTTLRSLIDGCELTYMYQPIIDHARDRIVGVEALVRPCGEENNGITADLIINEARRLGRLTDLSIHMLHCTSADMARFRQVAPELRSLHVNIDVEQAVQPEFLEVLTGAVATADWRITLELGEMSLHRVTDEIVSRLEVLRSEYGVRVALDDFGRNSSTLRAIADYPLDVLKVDRSMIEGIELPTPRLIIASLAELCAELDAEMIVEGVEDPYTCATLAEAGVRQMQGFYFGPPATADDLLARLSTQGLRADLQAGVS